MSVRLLAVVLLVQLALAGLLIWGAATGFSFLSGLLGASSSPPAHTSRAAPPAP